MIREGIFAEGRPSHQAKVLFEIELDSLFAFDILMDSVFFFSVVDGLSEWTDAFAPFVTPASFVVNAFRSVPVITGLTITALVFLNSKQGGLSGVPDGLIPLPVPPFVCPGEFLRGGGFFVFHLRSS